jgi:hypothetical protein
VIAHRRFWQGVVVGAVIAVTVALRWPLFGVIHPPGGDAANYHQMAVDLAARGPAYVWGGVGPWREIASYWPPLWIVWLAGVYLCARPSIFAAQVGNLVLAVATVLLLLALGRRLHPLAGWVAAVLWALNLQARVYAATLQAENLMAPLMVLCLLLALSRRWTWCAVALGLLVLTRQAAAPIVVVVLLACWVREHNLRLLVSSAAIVLVFLAPWSLNRSIVLRTPTLLSSTTTFNVWMGNHPDNLDGGFNGPLADASILRSTRRDGNGYFLRETLMEIRHHPAGYLLRCATRGTRWAALAPNSHDEELSAYLSEESAQTEKWLRLICFPLAVLGTALAWKRRHQPALLIAAAYWVYAATVVLTYLQPRFIEPVVPLSALLIGAVVGWAVDEKITHRVGASPIHQSSHPLHCACTKVEGGGGGV